MHPNIIDVCDAGEKSGFYFLIHEVEAMADNQKHQKIEIIDNFIGNVELSTEEYKGEAAPLDILLHGASFSPAHWHKSVKGEASALMCSQAGRA